MTVKCYICNDDIEITIDELVEYGQEEDNEWVCDNCCELIVEWVINRN